MDVTNGCYKRNSWKISNLKFTPMSPANIVLMVIIGVCAATEPESNPCTCIESKMDCKERHINDISQIHQNCTVKELNLSRNDVSEIKVDDFKNFPELTVLDLSYNHIRKIEEHSLMWLKNLKILNLSNNILSHLHETTFMNNTVLEELYLNNNNLNSFPNLHTSQKRLGLKGSDIAEIPPFNLPKLNYLDIRYNELKNISLETRLSLEKVNTIKVHPNPWACWHNFEELLCWIYHVSGKPPEVRCMRSSGHKITYSKTEMDDKCKQNSSIPTLYNETLIYPSASNENSSTVSSNQEREDDEQPKQGSPNQDIFSAENASTVKPQTNDQSTADSSEQYGFENKHTSNDTKSSTNFVDVKQNEARNDVIPKHGVLVTVPIDVSVTVF
ncbi:hypothetical protein L9F63_007797 [Diploptera punctata]|uniref:Uncharacterized protein n=1 Tax=Diploptera punctata TaxID=6984 RepID=A0AAD7Z6V9_DIPPU|nr:hypothetical protein L9F63_007797 [Diploptera punctata]